MAGRLVWVHLILSSVRLAVPLGCSLVCWMTRLCVSPRQSCSLCRPVQYNSAVSTKPVSDPLLWHSPSHSLHQPRQWHTLVLGDVFRCWVALEVRVLGGLDGFLGGHKAHAVSFCHCLLKSLRIMCICVWGMVVRNPWCR